MKNATKHADTLKSLLKKLPKELRAAERPKLDAPEAIVRAGFMYDATDAEAEVALELLRAEFTDWNEFRVATELELQSMIGEEYPKVEERISLTREVLQAIFDRENSYKLDRLRELKKAEQRQYIADLNSSSAFIEAYLALASFDLAVVPIDEASLKFLIDEEVVEPETTAHEAMTFLESHLKVDDAYPFFLHLREQAIGTKRRKR